MVKEFFITMMEAVMKVISRMALGMEMVFFIIRMEVAMKVISRMALGMD
jgi:hypothetical protein